MTLVLKIKGKEQKHTRTAPMSAKTKSVPPSSRCTSGMFLVVQLPWSNKWPHDNKEATLYSMFSLMLTGTPYKSPSLFEATVFSWSKLSNRIPVQQFNFLWTSKACTEKEVAYIKKKHKFRLKCMFCYFYCTFKIVFLVWCGFTDSAVFCFCSNLLHVWIEHILGGQQLLLQLLCQLRQGQRQNESCVWCVLKANTH